MAVGQVTGAARGGSGEADMTGCPESSPAARTRSPPPKTLDGPTEAGENHLGQLVLTECRGTNRLPLERSAHGEWGPPGTARVLRRDDRRQTDREPASLLEDEPGQGARECRAEASQRRLRRRACLRGDIGEADHAVVVGDPQDGQPPVVGSARGSAKAGPQAPVADSDLVLAKE
jgi:hypothetical protein